MKLRQKSKRDQALDAVASVAKTWSEWRLGKKATKTVAKGAKKASSLKGVVKSTPVRIAGAVALVGGVGAAVAKKMRGGSADPDYTPPPPAPAPMPPVADVPPAAPTPVVVEDLANETSARPEPAAAEPEAIAEPAADEESESDGRDPDAAASADAPAEGRL